MSALPICICLCGGLEITVTKLVVIGRYSNNGLPAIVRFLDSTGTPYQVRAENLRRDGRRMTPDEIEAIAMVKEVQVAS